MSSAVPALEGAQLSVAPAEGHVCEAMFDSMIEIERARRFGFHESEIFRAKKALLSEFEEAYIERDQTDSSDLAGEFVSLFLRKTPMPGIEFEARMVKEIMEKGDIDTKAV